MKFVSYSQNFEDLMLWRALKDIETGFYIDVGANDPEIDSVTKAFYDRGWHGINIEPVAILHEKLQKMRPRDINLQIVAGEREGRIDFYEVPETGLSTSNELVAAKYKNCYKDVVKTCKVDVTTLTSIIESKNCQTIHFLKIDVEGTEEQVLKGLDLNKIRPWILLIEANSPNSTEEVYEEWEHIVLGANYRFAYADGLNRFYLAKEKLELLHAFRYPPNVFDNYIKFQELNAMCLQQNMIEERENALMLASECDERAKQAEERAKQAEERAKQADALWADISRELSSVYGSKSWRITAPLRLIINLTRLLRRKLKHHSAMTLSRLAIVAFRFPKCVKIVKRITRYFPKLESKIRANLPNDVRNSANAMIVEHDLEIQKATLSPLAIEILNKLNRSI